MAQLGNRPTFNRGLTNTNELVLQGYHSRTIFSYSSENLVNLYNTDVTNESNTDGIQFLIDNSGTNDYHGSHILPAYYWKPGKVLRVRGSIIASSTEGSGNFNMRFGLNAGGLLIPQWLAIQNNSNNHSFANNDTYSIPVDFACDIYCAYIENDETDAQFGASGYYQYQYIDANQTGNDFRQVYVPVWDDTYIVNGLEEVYYNPSTVMFNLLGSTISDTTYVTQLTIEELA